MDSVIELVRIGNVARKLNLSVRRILQYEEEGLVMPHRKTDGGHRLFSEFEINQIRNIKDLIHERGLTVAGIKYLLKMSPCWEVFPCESKEKCQAFKMKAESHCWEIKQSGNGDCACMGDCDRCPVYLVSDYETKPLFKKSPSMVTDLPISN
jgi:MerR family transcriptional regulator, repressor of the yfmOP operon